MSVETSIIHVINVQYILILLLPSSFVFLFLFIKLNNAHEGVRARTPPAAA